MKDCLISKGIFMALRCYFYTVLGLLVGFVYELSLQTCCMYDTYFYRTWHYVCFRSMLTQISLMRPRKAGLCCRSG